MPTFVQRNCILNSINRIDQISTDDNGSTDNQFKCRCLHWKSGEIDEPYPSFLQPTQTEVYAAHRLLHPIKTEVLLWRISLLWIVEILAA